MACILTVPIHVWLEYCVAFRLFAVAAVDVDVECDVDVDVAVQMQQQQQQQQHLRRLFSLFALFCFALCSLFHPFCN